MIKLFEFDEAELLEELVNLHQTFVVEMPSFFGLAPTLVTPLPLRLERKLALGVKGLLVFDDDSGLPKEILIDPFQLNEVYLNFLSGDKEPTGEIYFTAAHESAHYLHHFKKPTFYADEDSCPRSVSFKRFKELVADFAAFEFFRRQDKLSPFITKTKEYVLKILELPESPFSESPYLANLPEYCLYQQLYERGALLGTMLIEDTDTKAFRRFDRKMAKINACLIKDYSNVRNIDISL